MKNQQTLNENFILIDGQEATRINKVAQEYRLLDDEIKRKTLELEKLKNELKALNEGSNESNTYETLEFIISLVGKKGSKRLDNKTFEKLYPNVFEDERIWTIGKPVLSIGKVERKV